MSKTIVFANKKGGVCKTTSMLCIGSVLQRLGFKVLYVDLDEQCNATITLGADENKNGSYEILKGFMTAKECTQLIKDKYYVISGKKQLATLNRENNISNKLMMLEKGLEPVKNFFDFIVIDTPPNLSFTSLNALACADYIVIPCFADVYSLDALDDMNEVISELGFNKKPRGVLITKFHSNRKIDNYIHDRFCEKCNEYGIKLFDTAIRESITITEGQYLGKDLNDYAPKSHAYLDYINCTREILKDLGMLKEGV